ncbi:GNAT family N-acetyltransferase [Austwickia chelonae]|uniref:GNAT family N-acetyltransferase n=1 Tax=Austwickia chelonae TaxID=100225 RepID=UPI000E239F73|nr:GNAT family N-acetyltransferase [Austwickia chelonae]
MTLQFRETSNPAEFLSVLDDFLSKEGLLCSMLVTTAHRSLASDPPQPWHLWWWVCEDGVPVGAAILAHPGRPYLALRRADVAEAFARRLSDHCAEHDHPLQGVHGLAIATQAFARVWIERHGGTASEGRQDFCYELAGPVAATDDVAGRARRATLEDLPWLNEWGQDFLRDIGDHGVPANTMGGMVSTGRVLLWESGGVPVAMAFATPEFKGRSRIGWVYTPEVHRGHGYGRAVTAAVARMIHEEGGRAHLFADVTNPTPNRIYRELGFVATHGKQSVLLEFIQLG